MTPILSRLLSGVEKLSNFMNNLKNALPALNLIENILRMLYQPQQATHEDIETLKQSVSRFNDFYVNLCLLMIKTEEKDVYNEQFKLRYETFKKASSILNNIQKYSNP